MSSLAEEIVDAINEISGVHPGHRAAHAKGTLLTGTFTPSGAAASLTTASHMQGEPVRVTARFSNGGGDPDIPDYAREGRGMAVKFYLPTAARPTSSRSRCPASSCARRRTSCRSRGRARTRSG